MIKEYQINKTGEETSGGYSLPSGFTMCVHTSYVDSSSITLVVLTCESSGAPALSENEKNLSETALRFPYTPASDNGKSLNNLLSTHFEALLDTWFGDGNWVAL